jgi:hypothetical protein
LIRIFAPRQMSRSVASALGACHFEGKVALGWGAGGTAIWRSVVDAERLAGDLVKGMFGGKCAQTGEDEERDRRLKRERGKREVKAPSARAIEGSRSNSVGLADRLRKESRQYLHHARIKTRYPRAPLVV